LRLIPLGGVWVCLNDPLFPNKGTEARDTLACNVSKIDDPDVNSSGAVCDPKISKFFVSHEKNCGRTCGYKWREFQKGPCWDQVEAGSRESLSLFQVLLKLMLT
jgi:hypothetical protein